MSEETRLADTIKQLYWEERLPLRQVSKILCIQKDTLNRFMWKEHIELRPKSHKRRTQSKKELKELEVLKKYGVKNG